MDHQYPKQLNFGNWRGFECQQGFYAFHYIGESVEDKIIDGTGLEKIVDLDIPFDHKLNIITLAKEGIDSDNIEVRYIPKGIPELAYDILYSNSAVIAKSIIIELGSHYENLGGAKLRFVITGTNGKWIVPRVNILFLEVPT